MIDMKLQIPLLRVIRPFLVLLMTFLYFTALTQVLPTPRFSLQANRITVDELRSIIMGKSYYRIFIQPDIDTPEISVKADNETVPEILRSALACTNLDFITYGETIIVIGLRSDLKTQQSASYYQALEESLSVSVKEDESEFVIGTIDNLVPGQNPVVTGEISDRENDEPIIGATMQIRSLGIGTTTDELGKFEIQLPPGSYSLDLQYIGYRNQQIPIKVIGNGRLDLTMDKGAVTLDEVVVEAQSRDENVQSVQVGVTRVSMKDIEKLPSFLGEVDVIKGLLLQPGVSTIGEGSGGFNVRGGNVDQNLIMVDEAIIFNASHALGFFSSFNSDIVSDATLYKGNLPANFGGRVASVLDVNIRDGNFQKVGLKGGLGVVSSRFTLDMPIAKDKTSILISGRSSYSDWLLKQINVPEVKNSSAFFYDANLRLTHRFNERNFISVSAYSTQDEFTFNEEFGFDYNTLALQANYQKLFGNNVLSTLSVVKSRYESAQLDLAGTDMSTLDIANDYLKIKENVNIEQGGLSADIGASVILYNLEPGSLTSSSTESTIIPRTVEEQDGIEGALYANISYELNPRLSVSGGLRFTNFRFLGPTRFYTYDDPSNPTETGILDLMEEDGTLHQESNIEPRFSSRYRMDESTSIKFGYARTTQYINQISNNETPTPTSIWQLTNQYIPSTRSHNFSLGLFKNFDQNLWITSGEVFYRHIDQLFDYRDFADLIVNDHLETELVNGTGRAYGLELSIRRQVGTINGWLNYTYSRTERRIDEINNGAWYPANFDKPHDLSIVTNIQLNKRHQFSFNFSFSSGRPITIPVDRHFLEDQFAVLNYSDRNAFRIPDYHRLDIAYTLGQGLRKSKRFKTSWTLSVYNVYARKNAFSVFLQQSSLGQPEIKRLAILGSAFPALTFNFELL